MNKHLYAFWGKNDEHHDTAWTTYNTQYILYASTIDLTVKNASLNITVWNPNLS